MQEPQQSSFDAGTPAHETQHVAAVLDSTCSITSPNAANRIERAAANAVSSYCDVLSTPDKQVFQMSLMEMSPKETLEYVEDLREQKAIEDKKQRARGKALAKLFARNKTLLNCDIRTNPQISQISKRYVADSCRCGRCRL